MLLKRWQQEAPEMIEKLEASGQLLPFLQQANERTLDLLYHLTIVEKKDYRSALEAAMQWSSLQTPRTQ
jgi:hypothetical protein